MTEQLYQEIGQLMAKEYDTTMGQMFGKPCLKTGKKAFAVFFKGAMVFKLGQQEVTLLKGKYLGAVNWDPSGKGRAMKDWLQVPSEFNGDWQMLARQAQQYVEASL